jgi:sirohydrochlorin cobaltochelatase
MNTPLDPDLQALQLIDFRVRVLLPEQYRESYESVQPEPMRSAGLKFDAAGKVAWDEMWQSFCDLALAGGPPHKGTLLEPGREAAINAAPIVIAKS